MTPAERWANGWLAQMLPYKVNGPNLYQLLYAQAILTHHLVYASRNSVRVRLCPDRFVEVRVYKKPAMRLLVNFEIGPEVYAPDSEGCHFIVEFNDQHCVRRLSVSPTTMNAVINEAFRDAV